MGERAVSEKKLADALAAGIIAPTPPPTTCFVVQCGCGEWALTFHRKDVSRLVHKFTALHPDDGPALVWEYSRGLLPRARP